MTTQREAAAAGWAPAGGRDNEHVEALAADYTTDPAAERHAIAARIALEVDPQSAFAVVAVGNNSRLGADVVRVVGILLDRLDEFELRLLDKAAAEVQRREVVDA